MKRRALISVSDKTGLSDFAKALQEADFEVISTGGTQRALEAAGVRVVGISEVTNFPEILDGRVKTLHPLIHGGLLADREKEAHRQALQEHAIEPIDLVVVNLYPFKETISKEGAEDADAIDNIDIGGPAMLRAAAKNHAHAAVVTDPEDYPRVLEEARNNGIRFETRRHLAAKAFRHTAAYDALVAEYMTEEAFPETMTLTYEKKQTLRYGENPHQGASFYQHPLPADSSIAAAKQLHGKELSYNNINDVNAAFALVSEFSDTKAAVAVKHTNPCGVGIANTLSAAFEEAYAADPVSIFGGIVALNDTVDADTAEQLATIFLEVIIAPDYSHDALELLQKKKNIRLLKVDMAGGGNVSHALTSVSGGMLVQEDDVKGLADTDVKVATKRAPTAEEWRSLEFAWRVVKHVKSNAIVLTKGSRTVGVGAGQMNRVGAAEIAIAQAQSETQGSALGSDAFFPMKDTVETAMKAGVTAVIQPGGSKRDQESIDAADEAGITMVFTGMRHFRHA
ncbi:bifunctional phosphoribosylaminoimidazolecarboxamide formyltransferase/IMP cyclohydrolase [Salicibibacter halophilus]|uniref:Bifunctional purine biosynthesis protein PurH n=1 Tax=Salicibibacter halophilus TaxID=2502791 RepID=A0A514LLH0_9BACI|nr:bifunctional phosphoribosylaminoimidazolecarboxamide formyltransferase/IMP cyclohydrolase [Salicibibacter halophilus]QDI92643.1 bifunctional phosphoribosylaminoimidazolecarboxamide formyltransferase/IMP cyclohydrolase [Salicibibacter halophilus]